MMKSFLFGACGACLVFITAALLIPVYGDYSDRMVTAKILASVSPIKEEINEQLVLGLTQETQEIIEPGVPKARITIDLEKYELPDSIAYIKILPDGSILLQGRPSGQIIFLSPRLMDDNPVTWSCIGGNYKAMPPECKSQ